MKRLKTALTRVFRPRTREARLADLQETLRALNTRLENALLHTERLLVGERQRVNDRASLAGMPRARLLAESLTLEGTPSERLRVARLRVGEPVERPFSRWAGMTRCATASPDVRELWERLLRFEAECGDDVLRGFPSTVLDVPGAGVAASGGMLRITPRLQPDPAADVVAVPRCAYDVGTRKIDNFGHWMLDYAPQIIALRNVAPDATVLMPSPPRGFQAATLALMGLDRRQMVPWDGSSVECRRLLAFESDGRTGGGRPLSPLMDVRRLLAPPESSSGARRTRRIYVSRRDAPKKRRWIVNEPDVEELFRTRGFDVVVMADCPLEEQVRLFRDAQVVAGLNGGGLTDLVFAPKGTHVIVLLSDTLMRWYAGGGRSVWASGARGGEGQLAALGDSPRFWTHVAAIFEQRCHSFVGSDAMPLGELAGFLDEVLAEVARG